MRPVALLMRPFQGRPVCGSPFRGRCPRLLHSAPSGHGSWASKMLAPATDFAIPTASTAVSSQRCGTCPALGETAVHSLRAPGVRPAIWELPIPTGEARRRFHQPSRDFRRQAKLLSPGKSPSKGEGKGSNPCHSPGESGIRRTDAQCLAKFDFAFGAELT
jgi:hypothetical protein